MNKDNIFQKLGFTQSKIAEIISGGVVTTKHRVRAHRIWNGQRPDDDDLLLLYKATNGVLDANLFYGLPKKPKRKRSN